jgi:NADH:ubiquinone oxidoreductase subunit 6 (subunit J)
MLDLVQIVMGIFTLAGALCILFTKNILHAVLGLLAALLGIAALYVTLNSSFLASMQILIYVGGVLVVLIFGILMSRPSKSKKPELKNENILYGGLSFVGILFFLLFFTFNVNLPLEAGIENSVDIKKIGLGMLGQHVLGLEFIGVFLLVVLIGATYLLRDEH